MHLKVALLIYIRRLQSIMHRGFSFIPRCSGPPSPPRPLLIGALLAFCLVWAFLRRDMTYAILRGPGGSFPRHIQASPALPRPWKCHAVTGGGASSGFVRMKAALATPIVPTMQPSSLASPFSKLCSRSTGNRGVGAAFQGLGLWFPAAPPTNRGPIRLPRPWPPGQTHVHVRSYYA